MKKLVKNINEETGLCNEVYLGDALQKDGFEEREVEFAYNCNYYLDGMAPLNPDNIKECIIKKIESIQTEMLTKLNSAFGGGTFSKPLPISYNDIEVTETKLSNYIRAIKSLNNSYDENPLTHLEKTIVIYDMPKLSEIVEYEDYYSLLFLDIRYDTVKIKTIMGW